MHKNFRSFLRGTPRGIFCVVIAVGLLLVGASLLIGLSQNQSPSVDLDTPRHFSAMQGSSQEVMGQLARETRIPMFVVLVRPEPHFEIPEKLMTTRQVLNFLVKTNPDYSWELRNSVTYFFQRKLNRDPRNFLNWRINAFPFGRNLAWVEQRLRSDLNKLQHGIKDERGIGMLGSGAYPKELEKHKLPTLTLRDVSASEIVIKALSMDRNSCSIVVFPRAEGLTDADLDAAFAHWQWVGFEEMR